MEEQHGAGRQEGCGETPHHEVPLLGNAQLPAQPERWHEIEDRGGEPIAVDPSLVLEVPREVTVRDVTEIEGSPSCEGAGWFLCSDHIEARALVARCCPVHHGQQCEERQSWMSGGHRRGTPHRLDNHLPPNVVATRLASG